MKSTIKNSTDPFSELWSINLQKLEEIHRELEKNIHQLEKECGNVSAVFNRTLDSIDILASTYARFNILQGGEYIIRLRTLIRDYSSMLDHCNIDFTLLDFLMGKISELRSVSFQDFPCAEPGIPASPEKRKMRRILNPADYPWSWITFSRGMSWFITPFSSLRIVQFSGYSILSGQKELKVCDPFAPYITEEPLFCIIIDSGNICYAAEKVGKRIHASRDMITPMIQEYAHAPSSKLSKGRVRLFGHNHIFLG